jgi:hypothetical protein
MSAGFEAEFRSRNNFRTAERVDLGADYQLQAAAVAQGRSRL